MSYMKKHELLCLYTLLDVANHTGGVKLKVAQTYCIINEATPSGTVAMDYFS